MVDPPLHVLDRAFCKIDTGHPRAGLGEELMICAKADADLRTSRPRAAEALANDVI